MRLNQGANIDVGQVIDRRGLICRLGGSLSGWAAGLILSIAGRKGGLRGVILALTVLFAGSLGVHAIANRGDNSSLSKECAAKNATDQLDRRNVLYINSIQDYWSQALPRVFSVQYSHHVQDLIGTEAAMRNVQKRNPDNANELSVMLELRADCYAGVWAENATGTSDAQGHKIFESITDEDIQQGLDTAAAIGDDTIQKEAGRPVDEQGFTHGSSAHRRKWFRTGHDTGDPKSCNTFGNMI